jgi:hypothetical protein
MILQRSFVPFILGRCSVNHNRYLHRDVTVLQVTFLPLR